MTNTLILFAHPNQENSFINKQIIESFQGLENVEIHDLYKLYPDFKIDIKTEQLSLKKANLIIFQFPLYWYSTPSLLKKWQDEVLTSDFAHGKKFKLEKKYFLVSFTIGSLIENYKKKEGGYIFSDFLKPLEKMAHYCKMIYKGFILSDSKSFIFNSLKKNHEITKGDHIEQLKKIIY